jgi:uncharacterized protein (TIGR00369 family)
VWAGFEVLEADTGSVRLGVRWRPEFGQYAGHLHAGMIAALIDTASGFAAYTVAGNVAASNCAVSFLRAGVGATFQATATVVKPGRRQVFVSAELHSIEDDSSTLIAVGQTLLVPIA